MTFEEQVKRLEEILEIMESGKVGLEEMSKLFAEGVELCKSCFSQLSDTKGKITILREELNKLVEKPLE